MKETMNVSKKNREEWKNKEGGQKTNEATKKKQRKNNERRVRKERMNNVRRKGECMKE